MRKQIHPSKFLLTALCAFCLGGVSVFADNTHRLQRERGSIESIDAKDNKLTVREAHNHSTQVFSWNQDTKFLEHERLLSKPKAIAATDLKPGEHVSIFYEKEENQWLARKIVVTRDDQAATHHKGAKHSQS
jgi:nitrous oxide reductase